MKNEINELTTYWLSKMLTNEEQFELLHLLLAKDYTLSEKSLSNFVKSAWPVLEPKNQYIHNWHIDLITEHLEAVTSGQLKRLIINIPPRYMKSLCVSVMWPVWSWIRNPELRWIFASYSQSLSTKHSVDRRQLIQSNWFQDSWSKNFSLAEDQNQKTEFLNSKRGHMVSTSVGGTVTGKGADIIIVDDPHNPLEASSDTLRLKAIEFFDQTLTTRLDNKKDGAIVVVMQRLHEEDLTGHLLEQKDWTHLCLPALVEAKTIYSFPISNKTKQLAQNEPLFIERENYDELQKQKRALGSIAFAAQYQQQPSPADGAIVKKEWFKFYSELPVKFDEIIQSWDCSFKDSENSDYVVGQVWGRIGANKYLLDQVRKRMSFTDTLKAVVELTIKWPNARRKIIEDKANGSAIISTLKDKVSGIVAINPTESKLARLSAICPQIEAGNVFLPDLKLKHWVNDFLDEVLRFPKGKNDDQVDCLSQALSDLERNRTNFDWIFAISKF
jgi:predicted phage terminase large subunit-like protein